MTDMQLVSLVLTLLAIFAAMIGNRKSTEDLRDVLRAEMKAESATVRAEVAALQAEMKAGFERLETKLIVHELEHHHK